jgi:hypothetical protein
VLRALDARRRIVHRVPPRVGRCEGKHQAPSFITYIRSIGGPQHAHIHSARRSGARSRTAPDQSLPRAAWHLEPLTYCQPLRRMQAGTESGSSGVAYGRTHVPSWHQNPLTERRRPRRTPRWDSSDQVNVMDWSTRCSLG